MSHKLLSLCVFCCRKRAHQGEKKKTVPSSLQTFPGSNGSKTLNDILTIYFIVRKLLKFSDAKCLQAVEALTFYADGVFWMCKNCECIVSKAVECHQQILGLQDEIYAFGDALSRVISESSGDEEGPRPGAGFKELRKLICSDLLNVRSTDVTDYNEEPCHSDCDNDNIDNVNGLKDKDTVATVDREPCQDNCSISDYDGNDDYFLHIFQNDEVQIEVFTSAGDESQVVLRRGGKRRTDYDGDGEDTNEGYTQSKKRKVPEMNKETFAFSSQNLLRMPLTGKYADIVISKTRSDFPCNYCSTVILSAGGYKNHLRRHQASDLLGNEFDCKICGFPTTSARNLQLHLHNVKYRDDHGPVPRSDTAFTTANETEIGIETDIWPDRSAEVEIFQEVQSSMKAGENVVIEAETNERPKRKAALARKDITEDEDKDGDDDDDVEIEIDDGDDWRPQSDEESDEEATKRSLPENSKNGDGEVDIIVEEKRTSKPRCYACDKCNVVYRNINGIKFHRKEHEKSETLNHKFDCKTCGFPASCEKYLFMHMKKIHKEEPSFNCSQCEYRTSKWYRLRDHELTHSRVKRSARKPNGRNENGLYECTQCTVTYRTSISLQKHLEEHVKSKEEGSQYECDVCNFPCRDEASLQCHKVQFHESDKKNGLVCKLCQRSFPKKFTFRNHLICHKRYDKFLNSATGFYECPICPEKNRMTMSAFIAHGNSSHYMDPRMTDPAVANTLPSFLCPECGQNFTSKSGLKFHTQHKHGDKKTGFTCEVCGKRVATEQSLKYHMRSHDKNRTKEYVCVCCGAQYSYKYTLGAHMAKYHPDQVDVTSCSKDARPRKPGSHKCKWCNEVFPFKYLLVSHMPTAHKDMYTFVCDICSKAYTSASSLNLHKEVIHSEGKLQFACEGCGKVFVHRHYSLVHRRNCPGNKKKSTELPEPAPTDSEQVETEIKLSVCPYDGVIPME